MAEYSQSWRKKLRIKLLVEVAENELNGEDTIKITSKESERN